MSGIFKDSNTRRLISIVLFIIYSCVLVYFLFFAENMGRSTTRDYSLNLIPFHEIKRFLTRQDALGSHAVWMNIAGNIIAFVPFGLFVIPVMGRNIGFLETVILTFDISLCVEIIQLITKVGSFDVDDLILNTIGGIIGAGIYVIHIRIERNRANGKVQI